MSQTTVNQHKCVFRFSYLRCCNHARLLSLFHFSYSLNTPTHKKWKTTNVFVRFHNRNISYVLTGSLGREPLRIPKLEKETRCVAYPSLMAKSGMLSDGLRKGITLFNRGQFFEAHEVLEDLWRAAAPADKKFLQGLTQLAVAFHHHSTGNLVGCRSVMARALRNLSAYPEGMFNMLTDEIVDAVAPCQSALEEHRRMPALPKLKIHR